MLRCYAPYVMTTMRLARAILAVLPIAAAAQPAPLSSRALREVARPAPVAAAPARLPDQQVTALAQKLLLAQRPLADRQLYAVDGGRRVRLTDQNIGDVLKRSPIAAE